MGSGELEGFDRAELGAAHSADIPLHASTSGRQDERGQAFVEAALES